MENNNDYNHFNCNHFNDVVHLNSCSVYRIQYEQLLSVSCQLVKTAYKTQCK